jgi:hypothetical protein
MRDPHDPGLDAIEQRLLARAGVATPAGHRDRVLAAVQEKVSATKSGEAGKLGCADCPDLVADTFLGDTLDQRPGLPPRAGAGLDGGTAAALVAMAISALLAVVAPWLVVARATAPLPMEPRIVAQARAAGIDLPIELVAAPIRHAPRPASDPREPLSVRLHEAWRLRNLLTGEL